MDETAAIGNALRGASQCPLGRVFHSPSTGNMILAMPISPPESLAELSEQLQAALHGKTFGGIFFWRFALVRPHDQAYGLSATRIEGEQLDLVFLHASGQGSAGTLSVWSPGGLEIGAASVSLRRAARLRLDDSEAWLDGDHYRIRTPRGEGAFPLGEAAALSLQF